MTYHTPKFQEEYSAKPLALISHNPRATYVE